MKAGTSQTFDCDECMAEFAIIYEPKAQQDSKSAKGIKDADVSNCPFCGAKVYAEDED